MNPKQITNCLNLSQSKYSNHYEKLLTSELANILTKLHQEFQPRRKELLEDRKKRQLQYDRGELPSYLEQNSPSATESWKVAPVPEDLQTRRVEITGPVNDPKMVINMLSRNESGSRADTAMLDFEDSMMPSWRNVVDGIQNVFDAAKGELNFIKRSKTGEIEKEYKLDPQDMAGLMVRVRGLHLDEANVQVNGEPISAGLFDLANCFFLTAKTLIQQGKTPKYYVPKCEHHLEARWWNDLFTRLEEKLSLPLSSLRATFLIETLPAAYQIEEILYELKDHAAGLNVGRWDKIFSDIKVLKSHKDRLSADRSTINMSKHWMDNYAKRLVKICHSHGAFAIGGMSAFTPGKDEKTRQEQTNKVLADKKNEFESGHDGCWVSHPYFIGPALEAFPQTNQLSRSLDDFEKFPDLLMDGKGPKTLEGLRKNIRVGIAYQRGWNNEMGCVSWDNLMEDLATLEISRAQTWQWLYHGVVLEDGSSITKKFVADIFSEELDKILIQVDQEMAKFPSEKIEATKNEFKMAKNDAEALFLQEELQDFLSFSSPIAKD